MLCPACKYSCDAYDKCPECGRGYLVSRELVKSRDTFIKVLLACHAHWIQQWISLMVFTWSSGKDLAVMGAFIFLAIGLAVLGVEALAVWVLLCNVDSSPMLRRLWCCIVGGSPLILIMLYGWKAATLWTLFPLLALWVWRRDLRTAWRS